MKKTYFAAAAIAVTAVALAVVIAGCDGFIEPTEVAEFDNSEGLIIKFKDSNGGRALTTPIAAAGADYFEVVFDNGSRKVRTSWGGGATGRIIPGNGDYDNTSTGNVADPDEDPDIKGKAYLFAGRNGTLLGVGVLVEVTNNDGTVGDNDVGKEKVINMAKATEVVFEITALNTDVGGLKNPTGSGTPPPPDPANSTFTIELAPGTDFSGNMVGSLLLDNSQDPPLTAPVFVVNPNSNTNPTDTINATFDITNTAGASLNGTNILTAIIAKPSTTARVIPSGFLWEAGGSPFAEVTGTITNVTAGSALALPIELLVIPGTKAGLSRLSIEIPVVLYDNSSADNGAIPVTWYVRGGLNNTAADQGAAFSDGDGSLGGAILIGVGEYNKNAAGLIIGFKDPMFK